jgi:hypothetical protein
LGALEGDSGSYRIRHLYASARDWILEHVLTVILILSAAAVIMIIGLIIATHH